MAAAKDARWTTPSRVGCITVAERATAIGLRRTVEAADEAQMRARSRLVVRVPRSIGVLASAAFRAAREVARDREGRWLVPGECLVRVARHFLDTWKDVVPRPRTAAAKVLARDGERCTVPGCSRAGGQAHHIQFRSAGGSDDPPNLTSLCPPHHLRGVHAGHVRVSGTAPHGLTWELGVGVLADGAALQRFEPATAH